MAIPIGGYLFRKCFTWAATSYLVFRPPVITNSTLRCYATLMTNEKKLNCFSSFSSFPFKEKWLKCKMLRHVNFILKHSLLLKNLNNLYRLIDSIFWTDSNVLSTRANIILDNRKLLLSSWTLCNIMKLLIFHCLTKLIDAFIKFMSGVGSTPSYNNYLTTFTSKYLYQTWR